mmetsp:Transcript_1280/g.5007  ORF Transcript_1280/g.5007 Transcript_1280/m.5007 type:complete len:202 (+) Transcript_1280:578-1183(+)
MSSLTLGSRFGSSNALNTAFGAPFVLVCARCTSRTACLKLNTPPPLEPSSRASPEFPSGSTAASASPASDARTVLLCDSRIATASRSSFARSFPFRCPRTYCTSPWPEIRLGTNTPSTSSSSSSSSPSSSMDTSSGSSRTRSVELRPESSVLESFLCLGPAPVFSPLGGCRCRPDAATRLTYSVYASPPPAPPPGPNLPLA